jgi:hypothetical protein
MLYICKESTVFKLIYNYYKFIIPSFIFENDCFKKIKEKVKENFINLNEE